MPAVKKDKVINELTDLKSKIDKLEGLLNDYEQQEIMQ
jgi:tetrahydromethanopterin S-methyltransferase subunit B